MPEAHGQRFRDAGAFSARERVDRGRASEWSRTGDSGEHAIFKFCPMCGSTVYWEMNGAPEFIAVAVGAFADPGFPSPHVSVYEERQHEWTLAAGQLPLEDQV